MNTLQIIIGARPVHSVQAGFGSGANSDNICNIANQGGTSNVCGEVLRGIKANFYLVLSTSYLNFNLVHLSRQYLARITCSLVNPTRDLHISVLYITIGIIPATSIGGSELLSSLWAMVQTSLLWSLSTYDAMQRVI